jgi:hypothetical protein
MESGSTIFDCPTVHCSYRFEVTPRHPTPTECPLCKRKFTESDPPKRVSPKRATGASPLTVRLRKG